MIPLHGNGTSLGHNHCSHRWGEKKMQDRTIRLIWRKVPYFQSRTLGNPKKGKMTWRHPFQLMLTNTWTTFKLPHWGLKKKMDQDVTIPVAVFFPLLFRHTHTLFNLPSFVRLHFFIVIILFYFLYSLVISLLLFCSFTFPFCSHFSQHSQQKRDICRHFLLLYLFFFLLSFNETHHYY